MRVCKKCGEEKPIEEFLVNHRTAGFPDIDQPCHECKREKYRLYYQKNRNKVYRQNVKSRNRNKYRYNEARNNRQSVLVRDLSDEYIKNLFCNDGIKSEVLKIYPELIENRRMQIKVKRLLKSIRDAI